MSHSAHALTPTKKSMTFFTGVVVVFLYLGLQIFFPGLLEDTLPAADDQTASTEKQTETVLGTTSSLLEGEVLLPVVAVVDGDTFKVQSGDDILTVRLLGIDTPETVAPGKPVECYGPEASEELSKLIEAEDVILVPDTIQPNVDRYGRYLRFAYVPNGIDVSAHMLAGGFAKHYTKAKTQFDAEYVALEAEAQKNKLGLWGECF